METQSRQGLPHEAFFAEMGNAKDVFQNLIFIAKEAQCS
jgi:hypothetical protein